MKKIPHYWIIKDENDKIISRIEMYYAFPPLWLICMYGYPRDKCFCGKHVWGRLDYLPELYNDDGSIRQ